MAPIGLPSDFRDFLKSLRNHRVEYLLIGGFAVGYHGYPRATADIDVWVARNQENAERIIAAVRDFGYDVPDLSPGLFIKENKIVRMGWPPLRIEIWTDISGVNFEECYASRIIAEWDDITIDIIDLDHLKLNKKASGRYKDLNDLENLP